MSDSSESQLRFDLDQSPDEVDTKSDDSKSPMEKLLNAHNTTEARLDTLAGSLGSYSDAYYWLGITRAELDAMNKDELPLLSLEVKQIEPSISVNLGERALHLSAALDEYEAYSRSNGFDKALKTPHKAELHTRYDDEAIGRIVDSQESHIDKAESEFSIAYGLRQMLEGGADPIEEKYKARMQENRFIHSHIGPDKKGEHTKLHRREKLRKTLKSQLK